MEGPPGPSPHASIRFNNRRLGMIDMSRIQKIAAWVGIIGGGIGFFFFSQYLAEAMR